MSTADQVLTGSVRLHFTMTLDGFIAGPEHDMSWMTGFAAAPGELESYADATGAVLAGRDAFDVHPDISGIYGGTWHGPVFLLTHHPEDAPQVDGVRVLSCDVGEAARIALDAADGRDLEVFSASIGRQLLERGLVDTIELHLVPILLGDGIRLFERFAGGPIRLRPFNAEADPDDAMPAVTLRYRVPPAGHAVAHTAA